MATKENRVPGVGQGAAGIDALADRGAVPKHTTPSQAAQLAREATDGALMRPRKYRQLVKFLAGRSRVIIRGKNKNDPAIIIELDSSGGRS